MASPLSSPDLISDDATVTTAASSATGCSSDGNNYQKRRAASVHHIATEFLDQVISTPGLSHTSTIYEIENLQGPPGLIRQRGLDVVCPVDGQKGAAYVDCLEGEDHVGEATHMLSYAWSYSIGDIVDTLVHYCTSTGKDPRRAYVWMCCLCVNQHRVVLQKKEDRSGARVLGGSGRIDFFAEFGFRWNPLDICLP
ncbi:hypothetical protein SEMRO_377_G130100.1 [Seminavis robusta]|uniref:Uncharacterized protein n=1 Tax=Seminavis robusta TaxID=568900 RepID=A0A9N8DUX9_9STRA|nr:hypothetical protein SEMRO_377_G130100.1 [Seminavis robusta]|eukprot:Sro377_g130100.1 n/a (196) ;mRNA; f:38272-38859